jgi:hypothetical protein
LAKKFKRPFYPPTQKKMTLAVNECKKDNPPTCSPSLSAIIELLWRAGKFLWQARALSIEGRGDYVFILAGLRYFFMIRRAFLGSNWASSPMANIIYFSSIYKSAFFGLSK